MYKEIDLEKSLVNFGENALKRNEKKRGGKGGGGAGEG